MKLVELTTDNTTLTGYECQKVGTNEWKKINHLCNIKTKCGKQIADILDKNGHYIGECEGEKCLFGKS